MSNNQVWVKNNLHNDNLDYDYDIVENDKNIFFHPYFILIMIFVIILIIFFELNCLLNCR